MTRERNRTITTLSKAPGPYILEPDLLEISLLLLLLIVSLAGCGGTAASPPPPVISVSVSPTGSTVVTGATQQFTATVNNAADQTVAWSVNGAAGGNSAGGTINSAGLYKAPAVPPSPNVVTIAAASTAAPGATSSATVTVVNPAPVLVSPLTPGSINAGSGNTTLTVSGTDFIPQSSVLLNGIALSTTFVSATQLTAVVPAAQLATAGSFPVTIVTPAPGGGTSSAVSLSVTVVVAVSPAAPNIVTGQALQFTAIVTGSANQAVTWTVSCAASGAACGSIDATSGLYTAPAIPPAPDAVIVKAVPAVDKNQSSSASVTVVNPVPAIAAISVTQVPSGSADTTFTVTGTGFAPQSVVNLNGSPVATVFVTSSQLTATIPAAMLVNGATLSITVRTPAPGGGATDPAKSPTLTVVNPAPVLASISPNSIAAGSANTTLTVAGTGFAHQSTILLNGVPLVTTYVSATQLTAQAAAAQLAAGGIFPATVTTPSPGGGTSSTVPLTVLNPAPVLLSLSPVIVNAGSGNTTLTLNGTSFTPQSVVTLNGVGVATTLLSATQLTAVVPASQLSLAGKFPVSVTTPAPGGGAAAPLNLAVVIVVTVTPSAPAILVGQTQQFTATVTGSSNQTVTWSLSCPAGGVACGTINASGLYTAPSSPTVVSIKATAAADPAQAGVASVSVVNPTPILAAISVMQVKAGSPDTAPTITGSGFIAQSVVQANGIALATVVSSTTQLIATIPAAMLVNAGNLTITVTNPAPGGGISAGLTLQVVTVVSVSPPAAAPLTGFTVQFSAKVTGAANQGVIWSIDGAGSGNNLVGNISPTTGLYTAPAMVPYPANITVRAVSAFDNTGAATAAVTITSPVEDWPKYHRDLANTGRGIETGINSQTAPHVKKKWSFLSDGKVSASPAVATIGGKSMLFVGSWNGTFYALDAVTGTVKWSFAIDAAPSAGACASSLDCKRIASSAAVSNGKVYFGAGNGFLYCLDAATGALVWKFQITDPTQGGEIWTSPAVYSATVAGKLKPVVAAGLGSHNDTPCVPGQIELFDALSGGTPLNTFDILQGCPVGQSCVGGGVWSSPAVDTSFGSPVLYIGTGNPGNGCTPASTAVAAKSYTDGILALDGNNLGLLNFYQAYTTDLIDEFDFGSSVVLHSTSQCTSSGSLNWVTEANKGGTVFTLPRGATGFTSLTAQQTNLNPDQNGTSSGELIATPVLVPGSGPSACNNLYQPTEFGYLDNLQQAGDGAGAVSPVTTAPWPLGVNITGVCSPPAPGGTANCPMFSAPASVADVLAFGGGNGNFYIYTTAGAKLLSFGTAGLIASGPAVSNNRIYFGSYDKNIYCLSVDGQ